MYRKKSPITFSQGCTKTNSMSRFGIQNVFWWLEARVVSSYPQFMFIVKKLNRSTSGKVYLKHMISQWTQLQSKLHAGLHKENFGSGLAGCGDYRHHCPCTYWRSLMVISFVWFSKWVIYLQTNIHAESGQSAWSNPKKYVHVFLVTPRIQ